VQAGSTTPGYVPQDDIVHRELVVEEALGFAARLRLGPRPPIGEIRRAVGWAMDTLGIVTRRTLRIGRLSGGQRKRVSVASELVARPRVLLLDEPTSGLDPAAEMRLMQRLRQLADTGCTVLCSTHVPANFHLANRVLILDGGRLVYDGPPDEAAAAFGERDLIAVYGRLGGDVTQAGPKPEALPPTKSPTRRRRSPWDFFSQATLLFHRQAALFRGDSRQLLPLILAPVAVGLLAGWSGRTEYLALFVAWLSTLWFGCNDSAQEFVREAAIYRRERMAGLVRSAYLGVRFLWLTGITCSQAVLLVAALMVSTPAWHSAWGWVMMTIIASAAVGVACGLAISAWARQLPHALIAVPLLLIPLILLSGFVTPAHEMRPAVRSLAALTPSFSAQRMMDISCLWGKPATREVLEDYWVANLNLREVAKLKTGDTLRDWRVAAPSVAVLVLWIFGGLGVAWAGLIHRERPS